MAEERRITAREADFAQWYQDVVEAADLADDAPVRGCMIIKPHGYAIWEALQRTLDAQIKAAGAKNAYFPLLIPESFLQKEKDHIEGFAPECAVVTHGGGKELEEKLYIRPTSETIINHTFARWISSWRDLPLVINQWANVVRWELRPRKFLRTLEFLWQEGHTAHASAAEARTMVMRMLEVYRRTAEETLAISVVPGEKTANERFAGADSTFTIEAMMQNGWALQCGTSHDLGQHFAKAFDIQYQTAQGGRDLVYQTSWGASTRLIGALVMSHGDDKGIVLPPRIAPIQVVIVPIYKSDEERAKVLEGAAGIVRALGPSVLTHTDDRDQLRPGAKYHEWERKGIPLRLELGPRDLASGQAMVVRRDLGTKQAIPVAELATKIPALLDTIQADLLARNKAMREAKTYTVESYDAFKVAIEDRPGFYRVRWCGDSKEETRIKQETKATIRVILAQGNLGSCQFTGRPATMEVIFARNY